VAAAVGQFVRAAAAVVMAAAAAAAYISHCEGGSLMAHFAQSTRTTLCATSSSYPTLIAAAVTSRPEPIGQAFINGPHPDCLALEGVWKQTSYSGSFRGCFAGWILLRSRALMSSFLRLHPKHHEH
jgi:hypothetical protein